jgi:hypothetical protein
VRARGGHHAESVGIDRRDPLAQKGHAWLGEIGVRQAHVLGRGVAEHHVELRVPEDERVARLDERDAGVVAECVGQDRRELEPAESGAENENALHGTSLTADRG